MTNLRVIEKPLKCGCINVALWSIPYFIYFLLLTVQPFTFLFSSTYYWNYYLTAVALLTDIQERYLLAWAAFFPFKLV